MPPPHGDPLSLRQVENLPRVDEIGVLDLVSVCLEDAVPLGVTPILRLCDLGQAITRHNGVGTGLALGRRCSRRTSALNVRKIRLTLVLVTLAPEELSKNVHNDLPGWNERAYRRIVREAIALVRATCAVIYHTAGRF